MHISIATVLQPGHQVASGQSTDSPYPAGTIAMQSPFFNALGLDLSPYLPATLNLNIAPYTFTLLKADYFFKHVEWAEGFEAEDFSFVRCELEYQQNQYPALVYYPHPETKKRHFQAADMLEILAPRIPNIHYGDSLWLTIDIDKIQLNR